MNQPFPSHSGALSVSKGYGAMSPTAQRTSAYCPQSAVHSPPTSAICRPTSLSIGYGPLSSVLRLALALLLTTGALGTQATATITVQTSQELSQAIATASAGEHIVVAPGQYTLAATIRVAPLIIEGQSAQDRPVFSIASGSTILTVDAGPVTGVAIQNLVFEGNFQSITAIRAKATGVTVQGCGFSNFEGQKDTNPIIHFSYDDRGRGDLMQPCVVGACRFSRAPYTRAIYSLGPTTVEDCTFENIRHVMYLTDITGSSASSPRMDYEHIVRRNEIYRTEGTTWNSRGIITRSTAPKIYENRIYDITTGTTDCEAIAAMGNDQPGTPTRAEIYRNVIIAKWKAADSNLIHEGIEYGETPGGHGLIYENVLVGYLRPGIYNKGDHNRWFNNTSYFTDQDGYTRHAYGVGCEYKNNIQVGGWMGVYTAALVAEKVALGYFPAGSETDFPAMQHTCFWGLNEAVSTYAEGTGFMREDPKFVDPASLDFHLRWDSPCINAGDGSRDGLTVTDMGAYEYPIQVGRFSVAVGGAASWQWHNGFQSVAQRVIVRWHAERYPVCHDDPADLTVADVPATATSAQTDKSVGYFAAFVLDANGAWSAPTPDGVHQYHLVGPADPDTFAAWVADNFTAAEQANAAISGANADPDAAGLSNFARYAFNLPARGPVASPITVGNATSAGTTHFTLTFPRRTEGTNLTYILESSADLTIWTPVPNRTYTAGSGTITAQDAVAMGTAPRRFLRLRITASP